MKNRLDEQIRECQPSFWLNQKKICISGISLSLILGILHGVADAAAGFLLGNLLQAMSLDQASWLIILYNVLGFGYQPLAGMLTDKLKRPRMAVIVGLLLLLLALLLAGWQSQLAVGLAGIGSAFFHVGGGSLALGATPNRTTGPGIFAAPGVVGLAVGGALGLTGYGISLPIIVLLGLIMMGIIAMIALPRFPETEVKDEVARKSQEYDWLILALLSAIALSSTVWTSFQFLLQTHLDIIITLAMVAAVAKVCGSFLAERWGWQRWTVGSLTVATLLLAFGGQNLLTLLFSLALLQSNIPITLAATARIMPKQPATAAGFALGLAILIGGIPVVGGLSDITGTPAISALVVMATALFLWWVLKSKTFTDRNLNQRWRC